MSKIFGIGLPRTGTRSLVTALQHLGYRATHFLMKPNWLRADFETDLLAGIDAVADTPVCVYFPELDKRYPGSKFICTTRDLEGWLKSIERHQAIPLTDPKWDMVRRRYRLLTYGMLQFSAPRFRYVKETHDRNVLWYFRDRPVDLLVLDICAGEGWEKLCPFLGKPVPPEPFPSVQDSGAG